MEFVIPFNEVIYWKKIALNMKRCFRKRIIESTFCIAFLIIWSVTAFQSPDSLTTYDYAVAGILSFYPIFVFLLYSITNSRQKKAANEYIHLQIPATPTIWEFTDTHVYVKGVRLEAKMDWSLIRSFDVIENAMFLFPTIYKTPLMISEDEIDSADFKKMVTFLKSKTKAGTGVAKYINKG